MKVRTERTSPLEIGYFRVFYGGQLIGLFRSRDNAERFAGRQPTGALVDWACVFIGSADIREAIKKNFSMATDFPLHPIMAESGEGA